MAKNDKRERVTAICRALPERRAQGSGRPHDLSRARQGVRVFPRRSSRRRHRVRLREIGARRERRPRAARSRAFLSAGLHRAARLVRDAARSRPRALGARSPRSSSAATGSPRRSRSRRSSMALEPSTANLAQVENLLSCDFRRLPPSWRSSADRCLKGDNNGVVGLVHFWHAAARRRAVCRRRAVLSGLRRPRPPSLVGLLGLVGLELPVRGQWLLFAVLAVTAMFTLRRQIYAKLMNSLRATSTPTSISASC